MRNASCTKAASIRLLIAHPTTFREGTSSNAANYNQPSAVHKYVMSPAQTVFGCSTSHWRAHRCGATA